MESSINIFHENDFIKTSSDEKLFVKRESGWEELENVLYKSEKISPDSSFGNHGDYFAKYYRRYNHFKYSEDFTEKTSDKFWTSYSCSFDNSTKYYDFPYGHSKKMKGLTTNKEHYIQCSTLNNGGDYTFSIYVRPAEITQLVISLYDDRFQNGVGVRISLDDEVEHEILYYGDSTKYIFNNVFITEIDEENKIYRVGISARFLTSTFVYFKFNLCRRNSIIFKTDVDNYGMYINAAQLTYNVSLDEYIKTQGKTKSALTLTNIYHKVGNEWFEIQSKLYYVTGFMDNEIGKIGDIATLTPILNIGPYMKLGDGTSVDKFDRPISYMYYNPKDGHYYIKTKKSLSEQIIGYNNGEPIKKVTYSDCRLMYDELKPNYDALIHAILLNQQSYQHYTRCSDFGRQVSHRYGIGTSGCLSFYGNPIQRNGGY